MTKLNLKFNFQKVNSENS